MIAAAYLSRSTLFAAAVAIGSGVLLSPPAEAADHTVKMLNRSDAGMMVFEPSYLRIAPGDTVTFQPTDKSHNAESIPGMTPDDAAPFKGKINKAVTVTFEKEGVYGFKCMPHYTMRMVGVVVVGDSAPNLDVAKAVKQPGKASKKMAALLAKVETNLAEVK